MPCAPLPNRMELLRASALSAKGSVRSIGAAQWAAYLALLQCWVQRAVRRVEAAQLRAGRHHDPRKWGPSGGRGWSCQESRKQAVLGAARRAEGGGRTPISHALTFEGDRGPAFYLKVLSCIVHLFKKGWSCFAPPPRSPKG